MGCAQIPVVRSHSSGACSSAGCTEQNEYRIGPGDVLHISVWKDKDLSETATVRPDGVISFPLINDIRAAGLTPMKLRDDIQVRLKQYLTAPDVAVVVQAVHSYAVSVLGQVNKPGRYELEGPVTVLDVLAKAGGLTAFASPSKIVIVRRDENGMKRIAFDYERVLSAENAQTNFRIRPNDIVMVP